MSRIHEALARAAHDQDGEPAAAAPVEPGAALPHAIAADAAAFQHETPDQDRVPDNTTSPAPHVTALAGEPFPVELAAHAAARQAHRSPDAAAQAPPRARPPAARASSESIFERIDHALAEKVVADRKMSPVSREQYRRLAAVLHDAQGNRGVKVLLIASAVSGEGKTLTAANLALTLSESYQKRVLLIDADLRKPAQHAVFNIHTTVGLATGLEPGSEAKLTVHQVSPTLSVLPAGRPSADPMAGLVSGRMRQLVQEARDAFDWVIIDTPPVVLLPDANLLAAMSDGAILVIKANATPHDLVRRAAAAIGPPRILGTVLNRAATTSTAAYGAYAYQHQPETSAALVPSSAGPDRV